MEWVDIASAIVQAGAAVAIVVLTRRLAQTATAALTASNEQAAAAKEAISEVRRDRHFQAVPILNLKLDVITGSGRGLAVVALVTNTSDNPALNVRMSLSEAWDIGQAQEARLTTATPLAMIGPGETSQVPLSLERFPPGQEPRQLHTDWVLISIEYQGLLGSRIHQEWYWEPLLWEGLAEPVLGHGDKLLLYRMSGHSGGPAAQNDIGWMRG